MEYIDFAERLSKLREQKGVSARDMSLSIGQNPGYINNIETGKTNPSLDGIYYICDYLGVTVSEFFDTSSAHPARLNSIIRDMKRLNEHQLEMLAALVKDLIKR